MSSRRSCWVSQGERVVSKAWGHVSVRDESLEGVIDDQRGINGAVMEHGGGGAIRAT